MARAKHWCFTINNYNEFEQTSLRNLASLESVDYLVFGREVGASGTPHLQGYLRLSSQLRLASVRQLGGLQRAHLEVARGSPTQASLYCKKEGDFEEFGALPNSSQGRRTDFERFRDWVIEQPIAPTIRSVWQTFPSLAARYPRAVQECILLFGNRPELVDGTLNDWQTIVNDIILNPPDDRKINFVVDELGNRGKSWLTRWWFSHRDDMQRLSIGKRDDLAYAIDPSKKLFVFDIPRGQSEFVQYGILEQLKDQMLFSPKYISVEKVFPEPVHVVVFMNEFPDYDKMTNDRFNVINLDDY